MSTRPLFDSLPPPAPSERTRSKKMYAAVVWLRKQGLDVKRVSDRQSRIGERLINNGEIVGFAKRLGYAPETGA